MEEETMNQEMVNEEENYNTGDASLDNPRNQDGIGETELLVVSFGTSYNDNRRLTIAPLRIVWKRHFRNTGYAGALPVRLSLTISKTGTERRSTMWPRLWSGRRIMG